jgi:cardiolipin synthase A/B
VITIDGVWANVGSSNFENRSLSLNDEINMSMQNASVVAELEQDFHDDLAVSQELDLQSWSRRPLGKRAREYATDLIRQSL